MPSPDPLCVFLRQRTRKGESKSSLLGEGYRASVSNGCFAPTAPAHHRTKPATGSSAAPSSRCCALDSLFSTASHTPSLIEFLYLVQEIILFVAVAEIHAACSENLFELLRRELIEIIWDGRRGGGRDHLR